MLRKVVRIPEAMAHYTVGSALLMAHLLTAGFRDGRQPARG